MDALQGPLSAPGRNQYIVRTDADPPDSTEIISNMAEAIPRPEDGDGFVTVIQEECPIVTTEEHDGEDHESSSDNDYVAGIDQTRIGRLYVAGLISDVSTQGNLSSGHGGHLDREHNQTDFDQTDPESDGR